MCKKLFTVCVVATGLPGSYSQALAGPYYYDGVDQGGEYYDPGSPNGHGYVGAIGAFTNTQRAQVDLQAFDGRNFRVDVDNTPGGLLGLKGGWLFPDSGLFKFALEAEVLYTGGKLEGEGSLDGVPLVVDTNFGAWVMMVGGMVRLDLGAFEPYVGLGIGGVRFDTNDSTGTIGGEDVSVEDVGDWGWAYQLLVGGEFMLFNDRLGLFAEYKYMSFQSIEAITDFRQHVFGGGVRVHF